MNGCRGLPPPLRDRRHPAPRGSRRPRWARRRRSTWTAATWSPTNSDHRRDHRAGESNEAADGFILDRFRAPCPGRGARRGRWKKLGRELGATVSMTSGRGGLRRLGGRRICAKKATSSTSTSTRPTRCAVRHRRQPSYLGARRRQAGGDPPPPRADTTKRRSLWSATTTAKGCCAGWTAPIRPSEVGEDDPGAAGDPADGGGDLSR